MGDMTKRFTNAKVQDAIAFIEANLFRAGRCEEMSCDLSIGDQATCAARGQFVDHRVGTARGQSAQDPPEAKKRIDRRAEFKRSKNPPVVVFNGFLSH